MRKIRKVRLCAVIVLLIALAVIAISATLLILHDNADLNDTNLKVTFIDVEQGDSSFIEFPDHTCMLIDSGEGEMSSRVISLIKRKGYSKIDYILVTHPHSDHMGGMADILKAFDIGKIYMTNAVSNTSIYLHLLDVIESEGLKISRAKAGVIIKQTNDIEVKLISPVLNQYDEINNYSAVCRITYKDRSFLFMGDAEELVEKNLYGIDVICDVVKIGHHGSSTSSSRDFVRRTKAKYGILSLAKGNIYGHPSASVVKAWRDYSVTLLRTDELGNIVFVTDGSDISCSSEK